MRRPWPTQYLASKAVSMRRLDPNLAFGSPPNLTKLPTLMYSITNFLLANKIIEPRLLKKKGLQPPEPSFRSGPGISVSKAASTDNLYSCCYG